MWETIKGFFTGNIFNIILFIAVFVIGLIIIKLVMMLTRKLLSKSRLANPIKKVVRAVVKFVLLFVYLITLCSIVGIPISSFIAIFTALSVAIGLAVQASLSNLANGLVILGSKSIKLGEYVSIDGVEGTVVDIKAINTKLLTVTGETITVPHSKTINAVIKNYSESPERRIDLTVSVVYGTDIEKVKRVIRDVIDSDERVLKEKDNLVRLSKCAASSMDYTVRAWVNNSEYWSTYWDLNEAIVNALGNNGIAIPYQTIDINLRKNLTVTDIENASVAQESDNRE